MKLLALLRLIYTYICVSVCVRAYFFNRTRHVHLYLNCTHTFVYSTHMTYIFDI